ncbi:uncharacterized protein NPIL_609911 [Nephila pilipes]|uniref:Uncharacterized protein n=1 Tax=Nephila pilipes TaxID=299642 RepID=A0A8X6UDK3_NEPPI|nr:uncharacterized protein NPIL_609911 [Nephila pilipes]
MANVPLFAVTVIIICLLAPPFCEGLRKRKGPPKSEALFNCFYRQICECGVYEAAQECYSKLTEPGQTWLIGVSNTCGLNDFLEGRYAYDVEIMCTSYERDEVRHCFDIVNQKTMERMREVALTDPEETKGLQRTRNCLEAIIAYCESANQGCMR